MSETASTASKPRKDEEDLRFGAVSFDDPKDPTSGWMAIEGDEKAKRVDALHQMPSDVIFWTNIPYKEFFSGAGRTRSNLRHAEYLVCKPGEILAEWGFAENTSSATTPTLMAVMFARIAKLAFGIAVKCNPSLRMSTFFTGTTLINDVSSFLPDAEFAENEAVETCVADRGFVRLTVTGARGPKGSPTFKLRHPRLSYARNLLETMSPVGPFSFVDVEEISKKRSNVASWLCSQSKPFVAEIAVDDGLPDEATIYGFGNSTSKNKLIRNWVSTPELKELLTVYKKITVRNIWMGEKYQRLSDVLPEPVMKFVRAKISFGSWSAGIVAETIWRALCAPDSRRRVPGEQRPDTSWRGAWLIAHDKVASYRAAKYLYDRNHIAPMYGYGWLNCAVPPDVVDDLIRDGLACGVIPPMIDVPDNFMRAGDAYSWGGDPESKPLTDCILQKRQKLAWNTDEVRVLPPGPKRDELKAKIQSGLASGKI